MEMVDPAADPDGEKTTRLRLRPVAEGVGPEKMAIRDLSG
jgi:hypothetical protein